MFFNSVNLESFKSKNIAKSCIEKYFGNKVLLFDLTKEKYVNLCMEADICTATDKAYEAIKRHSLFENDNSFSPIDKDVRFVISILKKISKVVPQEYSAGIFLMHLQFIEKISII